MGDRAFWEKINNKRGWSGLNRLPAKFESLHPHQMQALADILDCESDVIVVDAPPGSGKTVIGEGARLLLSGTGGLNRGLYICHSISLQEQFLRDFNYARVLKGRSNYPTNPHIDGITAADCDKDKGVDDSCSWCDSVQNCPYERAKAEGIRAELLVVNSVYWLVEGSFGGGGVNRGRGLFVIDEADTLEQVVSGQVSVTIGSGISKRYGLSKPRYVTKEESWAEWIGQEALPKLQGARVYGDGVQAKRAKKRLDQLVERLRVVGKGLGDGNWTYEHKDNKHSFRPVDISNFAKELIWDRIGNSKVLLMSGTILDAGRLLNGLGYTGQYDVVRVPSVYPVANRPIRVGRGTRVDSRSEESRRQVGRQVSEICAKHPSERILVHSVSYQLAETIAGVVGQNSSRDMGKEGGVSGRDVYRYLSSAERESVIALWQGSANGVLVAPSLDRGLDLVGDMCRVVIIAKVPYPNLGDKVVSKRLYGGGVEGRIWYEMETVRSIVQMSGRAVRNEEDWAVTYILDSSFLKLWHDRRSLFPKWWADAVQIS